jgi:hypothetical protein
MLPAHERLDAGHAAIRQSHLGLVVEDQLLAIERAAELAHQGQPSSRGLVVAGVIDLLPRAVGLRKVHGRVGTAQQLVGAVAVGGRERDPEAALHVDDELLQRDGLREGLRRSLDEPQRGVRVSDAREQQGELVPAKTRDGVVAT